MRALLVALTAAATLALPASAGTIDPKGLVLVEADLPAGFRLDPTESYVFSNARFAGDVPANKKLVARSERVTGYLARYDKGARGQLQTIQSSTHVFRRVGLPRWRRTTPDKRSGVRALASRWAPLRLSSSRPL